MTLRSRSLMALACAWLFASFAAADDDSIAPAIKELGDLARSGTLFNKEKYKQVRSLCAKAFEERHGPSIKDAYGEDADAIAAFFEKQKDLREEFYCAIDEKHDKIPQVLGIFRSLWKKSPENVAKYPNLAIAVAVVWDDPNAMYHYRGHQVRTKSVLPSGYGKMSPAECFQYFVDRQKELKGKEQVDRLQLPWEFLVYVVDHTTPVDERQWAIKNYLAKRPMVGKIYHEVEYDQEMLRTRSQVCKLNGQPYTLESIRKNGGVCAMQADFAARVGKSLVVPAAYVGGQSQDLGLHAWVMWVEVKGATSSKVNFTLESHGRYLGDNYYTGNLEDPQTGQKIIDRDMERRLSSVAIDRNGKRQAELGMKYYDEICEYRKFDSKQRVRFLNLCLTLCQFNEAAWNELARQVKEGEVDKEMRTAIVLQTDRMLRTFAKYPDYTWKVANDLVLIQNDRTLRNNFYEKLVALYESNNRPDLACEARLKWAEFQGEDKKWTLAARGLSTTIQKFPAEGRYVPKLVEKLKETCEQYKGGTDFLGKQYQDLLAKIPPRRGNEPSKYCIQMHEQAIAFFRDQKGKERVVKDLESKLANVKGGRP